MRTKKQSNLLRTALEVAVTAPEKTAAKLALHNHSLHPQKVLVPCEVPQW
jgi:hypothetical protein